MMIQNNISFDSFYGRIIDPLCYKLLENNLMTTIGIPDKKLAPGLHDIFFDLIGKYVTNIEPLNKSEYTQIIYFIIFSMCIHKLSPNILFFQMPSFLNNRKYSNRHH